METFNAIPVTIAINALQPTWVSKRCMQHLKSLLLRCNCVLLGNTHNNKMERMNGEVRDREKVMRRLKRQDAKILTGYQIYHNNVRAHESLEGKTPAEASALKLKGRTNG
jgi:Integrase core domain